MHSLVLINVIFSVPYHLHVLKKNWILMVNVFIIFVVAQKAAFVVTCEYIWATSLCQMVANRQLRNRLLHHRSK